jgi:hypothetical protein
MFKLGFCVYGPQCRYRHTKLGGPPPDPKDVDAAKPREFRAGGRDSTGNEAGRGRGRYTPADHIKHIHLSNGRLIYSCSRIHQKGGGRGGGYSFLEFDIPVGWQQKWAT